MHHKKTTKYEIDGRTEMIPLTKEMARRMMPALTAVLTTPGDASSGAYCNATYVRRSTTRPMAENSCCMKGRVAKSCK